MESRKPFFIPAILSFPLAALAALTSIAGIALPSTYARETAAWAAQAIGGDWVNLFVFAPALVVTAVFTLKGSRISALLLGGVLLYAAYTFVLFAFAVHFNRLFLVYCAELGLTFYALAGLLSDLRDLDVRSWFSDRAPVRLSGGLLVAIAVLFYFVWLSEDIPAIFAGTVPKSVTDVGLATNPVHVIDLALVLPALLIAAIALFRGRSFGYYFAPIALSFIVLLSIAIGAMVIALFRRGLAPDLTGAWLFAVLTAVSIGILWTFLRHLTRGAGAGV